MAGRVDAFALCSSGLDSRAIPAYLASKPKGKFGVHHYTPEEWGFSAEGLRENLAPYIDHFGVALE